MNSPLKIGNAQGFWGDSPGMAAMLASQQPDIDFLTLDYLAEVSMSLLALQQEKDPARGYAADFIDELRLLVPLWQNGAKFKVIVNAGGLNSEGCARAAAQILKNGNLSGMKIGVVSGDNVLAILKNSNDFTNLDTGKLIAEVKELLVSANAYLGAKPIVEALEKGADIVITGRVADPSLTVACCVYHYKWKWDAYDKIAGATIAGHLLECGAQATGGISTNWLKIPDPTNIGYPIVEMQEDASFVLTKPLNTGGCVNQQTIKEQLLYELGDPDNYLSPDATVSFLSLKLEENGKDRIKVSGAKGKAPPSSYKVSVTYRDGYIAEGMLTLVGRDLIQKAHLCGEIVFQRVKNRGYKLERYRVECIGGGDVLQVIQKPVQNLKECVLRICAADSRKEALECFSKQMSPLITTGPQGVTGYAAGRPKVRSIFGYWPCLIDVQQVKTQVKIWEDADE